VTGPQILLLAAAFLASAVEMVEATTIVLAIGTTREWRSSLWGVAAGIGALAVVVGALGPAVLQIPLDPLRLVIGGLLLVFGLGWLRKAVLRASGWKSLHDEDAIFAEQEAAARAAGRQPGRRLDGYAFTICFKGVFLEGLEVAFIVLTFGSNQHDIPLAVIGAAAAVVVVVTAAALVRAPLSRVPENTLKWAVGVMLASFGTFWGVEGAGAHWPGSEASLGWLIPGYAAVTLGLVWLLRRRRERAAAGAGAGAGAALGAPAPAPVRTPAGEGTLR
jgi:uncharacterized membrane protein